MKKFNITTTNFEEDINDLKLQKLKTQLDIDKVPYIEMKDTIYVEDKDLTAAENSKNKVSF